MTQRYAGGFHRGDDGEWRRANGAHLWAVCKNPDDYEALLDAIEQAVEALNTTPLIANATSRAVGILCPPEGLSQDEIDVLMHAADEAKEPERMRDVVVGIDGLQIESPLGYLAACKLALALDDLRGEVQDLRSLVTPLEKTHGR